MKSIYETSKPGMHGIYEDFSGKIRAYLKGKVRSPEDIDDLTQRYSSRFTRASPP